MAGRRPGPRVVGRGARAPTNWGGTVATGLSAVPALSKLLLASFTSDFVSGETIRRMRGTLLVNTVAAGFHGAIGAYVANTVAIAAGVGSLLDPVTNVSDDAWFWYQSFGGITGNGSAGGGGAQLLSIDSKAMRRVETGYAVVFVVANSSATLAYSVALLVRLLGSEAS